MHVSALGDTAMVLELSPEPEEATLLRVQALAAALNREPPSGLIEAVPAFGTVAVFYDPAHGASVPDLRAEVLRRAELALSQPPFDPGRRVEIAVRYGGESGPDLGAVAAHTGLTEAEVVDLHSEPEYRVLAIGFAPGFPYLGGLPPRLHTPRRATPRTLVPAGSVGIGGGQTGIYPQATPGGWNLIGRTAQPLFRASDNPPSLLRAGDHVRFKPVAGDAAPARPALSSGSPARLARHGPGEGGEGRGLPGTGLEVVRAGPLTTIQDLGRPGHRGAGVPLAGAADSVALRIANLLVGNPEGAAALECTLVGPELVFPDDAIVAVGGAGFESLPAWQPRAVRAGERIALGACRGACRSYLAISGGIAAPPVLGSCSTYLAAAIGGFHGRALRDGDVIPLGTVERALPPGHWQVDPRLLPDYGGRAAIRILAGAHMEAFDRGWLEATFVVSPQSDRMGVRLRGPAMPCARQGDLPSGVVAPGTIQVPGDGSPIVLLADAQTIGGYPRVGHVIATDLPLVAQLRPGATVRFREVSLTEAHQSLLARERGLGLLHQGLAEKYGRRRTED